MEDTNQTLLDKIEHLSKELEVIGERCAILEGKLARIKEILNG